MALGWARTRRNHAESAFRPRSRPSSRCSHWRPVAAASRTCPISSYARRIWARGPSPAAVAPVHPATNSRSSIWTAGERRVSRYQSRSAPQASGSIARRSITAPYTPGLGAAAKRGLSACGVSQAPNADSCTFRKRDRRHRCRRPRPSRRRRGARRSRTPVAHADRLVEPGPRRS
jgi:hypothetical protein